MLKLSRRGVLPVLAGLSGLPRVCVRFGHGARTQRRKSSNRNPRRRAGDSISRGFHLGGIDLELSDRGRGRRRRARQEHLGRVLAYAGHGEERRHRRYRLRSLSPLGRGCGMAGARRLQRLSLLDSMAAHSAGRRRRDRAARARFLRPPGRRADHARRHALAVPLSLGFAAGIAGSGRLAQARHRRQIRRLCAHRGAAAGRPRQALGDVQRGQHPRAVRLRHGRSCAGAQGPGEYDPRQPSSEIWRRAARFSRCAPSAPICGSARCSTSRRCGRPSDSEADHRAVERFDAFWNGAFLDPLFKGSYPEAVAAEFEPRSPTAI